MAWLYRRRYASAAVRDATGRIDVQGTMQAITTVVEGWVREHPEQWLWLHNRWALPLRR